MSQTRSVSSAWILTFYAYKGGTGRTLALTNVARFMAEELGCRIGLIDLDLESPGLADEPLCRSLEAGEKGRQDLVEEINSHAGFIDLFNNRLKAWDTLSAVRSADGLANPQNPEEGGVSEVAAAEVGPMPEISDEDLDRHVIRLEGEGDGTIVLMPTARVASHARTDNAGNGSESTPSLYSDSLEFFLRHTASRNPREVAALTQAVIEKFIRRYNLDYLFLDGRTGTGPFFKVYTYAVPQLLVLFCGLNEQNIKGSLSVLTATSEEGGDGEEAPAEAPVLLVASPVPTVGPKMLEARLGRVLRELRELRRERRGKKNMARYIYELPRGVDFKLPYSDLASYEETYFLRRYPHSQLAQEYRRLVTMIETLRKSEAPAGLSSSMTPRMTSCTVKALCGPPLRIAAENVTEDHFHVFFEYCGYAPERTAGGRNLIVRSGADTVFEIELWSSEDPDSPWERLAKNEAPDTPLPDVLLFPQIHLGPLSRGAGGPKLLDLTAERLAAAGDEPQRRPRIFRYSFLDGYYPGWRQWCSLDARVMSLPFSINTMLLCANEDRLREVCLPYWKARRQARDSPFMPSSWPALIELLRQFNLLASTDRDWQPFRMVLQDRGLYYEWLNVVLALGGVDLHEREGRLLEEIAISSPRVIAATETFRDLVANTARQGAPRMDHQIAAFGQGRLALYVAWTDSFRFRRITPAGPITTEIAAVPRFEPPRPGLKIHLGPLPRDVQYSRKSVVDGWLMGFPVGIKKHPSRMRGAFEFASSFLTPDLQWKLLRGGFPTASRWAVDQELATLSETPSANGQRPELAQRNYEVFLRALRGAITDGHWVPSPVRGPDIYEAIHEALSQILRGDSVEEKLTEAERKIRELLRDAAEPGAAPAISGGQGHEP